MRHNDAWIDELLDSLDLAGKADTNMRALSGGMKRRVLVAQALVHKPPVVVLDEPTAGVDVALRQGLWEFIGRLNRAGHTIVLTTHYLEEAETLCNRIAMLKQGRIVALDTTANLLRVARRTQKTVRIRLSGGPLPQAIAARNPVRDGDVVSISLDAYDDLEQILAEVRLAGESVQDLEVIQPDLQDVFMQVMTRH